VRNFLWKKISFFCFLKEEEEEEEEKCFFGSGAQILEAT